MKSRTGFIIRYYINLVILFLIQKPLFMLFTKDEQNLGLKDYLDVMAHAFPMDLSVAGYLTAVPLIAVLVGTWWPLKPNFNARKVLKIYNILIAFLLSVIFVADISIYPFWHFKLDSTIFSYLATPKEASASVSFAFLAIRVLAITVVTIIIYGHLNHITPNTFNPAEEPLNRRITVTVMTLVLGGLIFLGIRGGTKESTMNVGRVYYSDNQYLNHSAVNPAFSLLSSMGKKTDLSKEYNFMENSEAEKIVSEFYINRRSEADSQYEAAQITDTLLNTDRPDILVILMESFGSTFTVHSKEYLGEVATPNFWKAAAEGVYFSNMYCNSYRTDRGTVSTFSGLPSFPKASVMKMPNIVSALPGIAKELGKAGYSTDFLYGGDINFTNTKGYLLSTGTEKIVADIDFPSQLRGKSKWGVHDEHTFDYLAERLTAAKSDGTAPFFTGFLTLSSHEPFEVPFEKYNDKVYNSAAYTDNCLGVFMERLKASDAWKNLLIILIPDHNMLYNTDYTQPSYFKCPMVWTGGAMKYKGKTIDILMNQSDLAATLLAQLGADTKSFPYSRNIFSPSYTDRLAIGCYNNGFMVADSTGETNYDLNSDKIVFEGDGDNSRRVTMGKAVLQSLARFISETETKSKEKADEN